MSYDPRKDLESFYSGHGLTLKYSASGVHYLSSGAMHYVGPIDDCAHMNAIVNRLEASRWQEGVSGRFVIGAEDVPNKRRTTQCSD